MRKTTNKKKLGAAALAMVMAATMPMNVLAVPTPTPSAGTDGKFNKNTADTTVNLEGMTSDEINQNLAATVPISVTLAVMATGDIMGPTNYKVQNTSQEKKIKVKTVKAEAMGGGYVLDGTAPSNTQVDLAAITMLPTTDSSGTAVPLQNMGITAGHTTTQAQWTMEKLKGGTANKTAVTIIFGGKIPDVTKLTAAATGSGGEQAFKLKYTLEVVTP